MQEKKLHKHYYEYSIACTVAYIIPVFIFFLHEQYTRLWLLYIGNSAFALLLIVSGIIVNKKLHSNASLRSLISPGLRVTTIAIIMICILLVILGLIFSNKIVQQAPTNYNGLFLALVTNAVLVNYFIGSFTVVIGAVTIKTNQRNEKGEEIT